MTMDGRNSLFGVTGLLSPSICIPRTYRVPSLHLRICQSLVIFGISGQIAAEKLLGAIRRSWSRILQSAVFGTEGVGWGMGDR